MAKKISNLSPDVMNKLKYVKVNYLVDKAVLAEKVKQLENMIVYEAS
jgi:hypothetical protein